MDYKTILMILLLLGVGFAGGWGTRGYFIVPVSDTLRVAIPVPVDTSTLDVSAPLPPIIKYIPKLVVDHSAIDSLKKFVDSLKAQADARGMDVVPYVTLDTTLHRYAWMPGVKEPITLWDTLHLVYEYYPASIFRDIKVSHQVTPYAIDTIIVHDFESGFNLWGDTKTFLLGAGVALVLVKVVELVK